MLTDALMLEIANSVARWFELGGIAIVVLGALVAAGGFALALGRRTRGPQADRAEPLAVFRKTLGRSILTGLELLVAADIIRTVAIEPTMENVLVLAVIVLIRTFLSLSLEVEIDGKWPWRRTPSE